ncbi:hypothetical protein OGAPHI_004515 [Ogataea philodendri]|uniref:Major facilitator superfamily (MFS) profile domain-containing protein n=1 Tax=Ogataea philodendri TaxID=1378263 RepID=A0A9P8P778_9ASCO|nr:uncharacterized protein OGAPHI_004515 [Ogataea philodendri]KAH3666326.1 hypothetical protein OGAPHI_004515 [Ogataea philodendri]
MSSSYSLSSVAGDEKYESAAESLAQNGEAEIDSIPTHTGNKENDWDVEQFQQYNFGEKSINPALDDKDVPPSFDQNDLNRELTRVTTNLSRLSRRLSGNHTIQSRDEDDTTGEKSDLKSESNQKDTEPEDEEGLDPRAMQWDNDSDPDNPLNWPNWKRWAVTMTIAFLCLVITIGSSIYVDAIPEMMTKWGISQTLGLSGLTFYLVGLAFGPTIAAPLSEIFGRKIIYCATLPISMLFTMGVGLSKHIREVLVLRFFAGLTASAALAIGGGTITDVWRPHELGLAMTLFCMAPLAGPVIGPIIGGFVAQNKVSSRLDRVGGLRWTMWVQLFFAAAAFIPVYVCPETYKAIIMRKRIKKRGLKMKKGIPLGQFLMLIVFITLLKPVEMLFVEPIVLVFSIYTAFIFAVLFGFFEAFPVIFRGEYHMTLGISGLPFLGVGLGIFIGAATYVYIDKRIFFKKWSDGYIGMKDKNGNKLPPSPESRLLPCKIGAVAMPPALFWLAWTGRSSVHWMAPIAAGVPFGFSLILIFFSILTYFSMSYPPLSVASALAANNFLRYVMSSVFPLFTVQMMENLHVYWGVSVFAFISLALAPVPWLFTVWGPRLRERSKYGFAAEQKQKQAATQSDV